jgi:gas vesicle protein
MGRFLYGAVVGGAAMYLLDPDSGQERRRKLAAWWRENRGSMRVRQAAEVTADRVDELKPAVRKASQAAGERAQAVGARIKSVRGQGKQGEGWTAPPPTGTEGPAGNTPY